MVGKNLNIDAFAKSDYIGDDKLPWLGGSEAKRWRNCLWIMHTGLPITGVNATRTIYHKTAGHAIGKELTSTRSRENPKSAQPEQLEAAPPDRPHRRGQDQGQERHQARRADHGWTSSPAAMVNADGQTWWQYKSAADTKATIDTTGYFNDVANMLKVNDPMFVIASDGCSSSTPTTGPRRIPPTAPPGWDRHRLDRPYRLVKFGVGGSRPASFERGRHGVDQIPALFPRPA